ncbi:MAG: hypothetical protein JAZ05_05235, partial [Candidatus Thiodiazotropha taylori]|nr:hypothetical protein [Candidatus Thiodiazotropha taylori]MCW4291416.1 hypothetical protein [Candidatus Thiodiazotropha taylori]
SDKTYEILEMVESRQPERPSEVSKYPVPKILEDLCMRCLAKEPASRPESMGEVIRTLEHEWASVK